MSGVQIDAQRQNMQGSGGLAYAAQFPCATLFSTGHVRIDLANDTGHIDNRVTHKHLGQAMGEVAGQTLAGALVKLKFEIDAILCLTDIGECDIISAFRTVTQKGLEKAVCAIRRKDFFQYVWREKRRVWGWYGGHLSSSGRQMVW